MSYPRLIGEKVRRHQGGGEIPPRRDGHFREEVEMPELELVGAVSCFCSNAADLRAVQAEISEIAITQACQLVECFAVDGAFCLAGCRGIQDAGCGCQKTLCQAAVCCCLVQIGHVRRCLGCVFHVRLCSC